MGAHDREQQQQAYRMTPMSSPSQKNSLCELCQQRASVYCPSDEANLCDLCDAKVHSANFLVARHSRHVLCPCCGAPALQSAYTGPRLEPNRLQDFCPQCRRQNSTAAACAQDVDALYTAESCCSDADVDADCGSVVSSSQSYGPRSSSIPPNQLRRVRKRRKPSSAGPTTLNTPEEGLGDSEDCFYGLSSPHISSPYRRRTRVFQ